MLSLRKQLSILFYLQPLLLLSSLKSPCITDHRSRSHPRGSTESHRMEQPALQLSRLLQEANIPHNILVVDCGQRLFLFPNNYSAAKAAGSVPDDLLDTQVDPATFEIAGHLILKRSEDYSSISQVSCSSHTSYLFH